MSRDMPAPVQPNRGYSFTSFQTANPTAPPPGNQLDIEIDRANLAIGDVINFTRQLIRDDGTLEHGSVGQDQLAPDLFDGVVLDGATQAHASATAAAQSAVASQQARNQAEAFALSASSSLSSVTGTATTAINAAQAAQTHRDEALSFRNQAQTHETNAQNSANASASSASNALLDRDLARKWATDTSGPVDDGLYSARFYAIATLGYDPAPPGVPAFSANLISFTPAPGISATNAQAAIEETYNESARTTHAHAAGDVTSGTFLLARLPVAASGVSSATELVRADDTRLSNARTPLTHSHPISDVTNLQTSLDAKANVNSPNFTGTPQVGGQNIWHAGNLAIGSYALLTGPNTFTGLQQVAASAAGGATFRIPHGAAPTAPVNGDIWTTTADLFVRLNGTTVSYARTGHNHAIADVTGLQSALDSKENAGVAVPRVDGSVGAAVIPAGTTAQRPGTPATGHLRWNSTLTRFEGWNGTAWDQIGGTVTPGGGFRGDNGLVGTAASPDIFRQHKQNLAADVTIAANENAIAAGPLTIDTGRTLTVTAGGNLVVM
jgi:hypothetical protein